MTQELRASAGMAEAEQVPVDVRLERVTKRFDGVVAVDDLSLSL